jgi:hypothetical protein
MIYEPVISRANGAQDFCLPCWLLINNTLQVKVLPAASQWNTVKEMELGNELSLSKLAKS